jgi:hypothetical protein
MGEVSHLAEHGSRSTVAFFRKRYRAGYRLRLNMVAGYDVLDGNLNENHRVFFRAHTLDMYLVASHILAFLAQNRDDIHAGTAGQADEEQFHGAKASVLSTAVLVRIKRDLVAGPAHRIEVHTLLERGLRFHYFGHNLLLFIRICE